MTAIKTGCALMMAGLFMATTGCVFKETYEAEKARSLNFQRLLAQEEKRTAELDSEVKRVKRDAADYEARNRELSVDELRLREKDLDDQLFRLRIQKSMGQLEAPAKVRGVRRDLARIKTILREKTVGAK